MPQIRPDSDFHTGASEIVLPTGASISYTDRGSGPVVVLIHGMCMTSAYFHPNIDPLAAAGYRMIALDLRSHGQSPTSDGGHTIGQFAADLDAFLSGLAIDRCTLVGWSMGNLVTWEYLKAFGTGRVASHVNVSQGPTDFASDAFPYAPLSFEALTGLIAGCQGDFRGTMAHIVPLMYKADLSNEDLSWNLDEVDRIGPNAGCCVILDQSLYNATEAIATANVPTLNIFGADEKLIPLKMGEWCHANIAGSEYLVFDESGHCPQLEEPERFNATMIDWLARHP